MPSYLTPGVYYERADEAPGAIPGVRTDVAGFVGVASRGPLGVPVRVTSWRQHTSTFGDLGGQGYLNWAVRAFFENGGQACHVVRVAAPVTSTVAAAAVQPGDGTSSLVVPAAGFVPGAVVTVSRELPRQAGTRLLLAVDTEQRTVAFDVPLGPGFDLGQPVFVRALDGTVQVSDRAAAQPRDGSGLVMESCAALERGFDVTVFQPGRSRHLTRQIAAVAAGGARLTWTQPLVPDLAPGPDLGFEAGAAAAAEVFLSEQGEPLLEVAAVSPGVWGDGLRVRAGRQAGKVTRSLSGGAQPADRLSTVVGDVSGFETGDLVRVWQAGARPLASHVIVADVRAGDRRLVWAAPLPGSLDLSLPLTFERVDLTLSVSLGGALVAVYPRLSMREEHPRYAPRLLASDAAALIAVTPLVDRGADPGFFSPLVDERWLLGGRDGLAGLTAADMVAGVRALADVDEVAMLAAPDAWLRPLPAQVLAPEPPPFHDPCLPGAPPPVAAAPPPPPVEPPPTFDRDDAYAVQRELVEQGELLRDRVALLDPPRPTGPAAQGISLVRDWRRRFDSAFAALFFPWLHVRDPVSAELLDVPPTGHITGLAALTDLNEGVHRAPANFALRWVQGVASRLDDAGAGLLNSEGICAIRVQPGRGIRPMGARTLSSDPSWRFLPVRRLFSMIEKSALHATQWAVFEPDDHALRETLRLGIGGLLRAIFERGALAGRTPEESYYVRCDDVTTPPAQAANGELVVEVGVAPANPAEFVVFRVGRVGDQVQVTEGTAAA